MKKRLFERSFYVLGLLSMITLTSPFFSYRPTAVTTNDWFIWGNFNLLDIVVEGLPRFSKVAMSDTMKLVIVISTIILALGVFQFVGSLFKQRKQVLFSAITLFVLLAGGIIYIKSGGYDITVKAGYYIFMALEAAVITMGILLGKKTEKNVA
ncbi:hypothetical protein [Flavobacterium beibuense]|uniref:Uncharacterized protein n=1 Tax=Flavobacterium beibuense TaxID=657326 RepID=A0A444WA20_9FLAO|nr:hypothetical protein [Flavobacterium beibuense]RYJ42468.1 hypothetical protein NU09_2254 [Flavobacterium beibuense]